MRAFFIVTLFSLFSILCVGQIKPDNKSIMGTWVNHEFLNCLRTCDSIDKKAYSFQPRFIYIDSAFSFRSENYFEHISHKNKLEYQKKENRFIIKNKGYLKLLNDSVLLMQQDTISKTFTKLSSSSVPGSGMQVYLRDLYFTNNKFWKLIHIDQNNKADTQNVILTATKILDGKRKYITEYEFGDTYQENFKNERLFTLMFFDVSKNYMSLNERLFRIKKIGPEIYLFNNERLEYVFVPEKD